MMSGESCLPLVVSHKSHTGYTCQKKKALAHTGATWPRSETRADGDGRWKARRGERREKGSALNMWRAEKKRKSEWHNSVNPEEVRGAARQISGFPPRGRLHRIHTMRDRNMAAAHFFSPNYQTPYWLSSGREEVILFLSPFGKLIHFTKVTW